MPSKTEKRSGVSRRNMAYAKAIWPAECSKSALAALRELTTRFGFSVALSEVRLLNGGWYVTHSGLLRLAERRRCCSILIEPVLQFSDPSTGRWVFKATVYKSPGSKAFVGYGDADPSNVSPLVHGAELRVAETRAVNRALRKAYGIGLCSVEEIGSLPSSIEPTPAKQVGSFPARANGSGNGQPRLRDRLCLLIRQHQLNPTLVKRYAADFCGTEALRDTPRDLVESFINNLAEWAARDREGLLCKLNSYTQPEEVKS